MQFVTEAWEPLNNVIVTATETNGSKIKMLGEYKIRHWLAIIGVAVFALAIFSLVLSRTWIPGSLLVSLGLLMVSTAALLVPDLEIEPDNNEPGKN